MTTPSQPRPYAARAIRRVAVIGAGTMGAGIAAHLANAGISTLLLDVPKEGDRDALARGGIERQLKAKPAAFMDPARARLIDVGNTEDDLGRVAEADWIIEAIFENLDAKRALWEKVEALASPDAIISSNSSGIPMFLQVKGRSESFRRRFVGAHFFNPPRYLHLLEVIPTPETAPEVIDTVRQFADHVLGKGVVVVRDVPGFAANRIAGYAFTKMMRAMIDLDLTPDMVDAITGPLIGRPKSATFRTADLSGVDIFVNVADGLAKATQEDFAVPDAIRRLIENRWLGDKTGQGFYKKTKDESGATKILTLNLKTFEYEDRGKVRLPELKPISALATPEERLQALLALDGPLGEFTRRTTADLVTYAEKMVGVVADTPDEIDNALRWGYGWQLGPFDIVRAIGADALGALLKTAVQPVGAVVAAPGGPTILRALKSEPGRVVRGTRDASLIDLGDGVALLEFTSKMNTLGQGVLEMLDVADEVVRKDFAGLVIGNQGENFSVGADLKMVLHLAREQRWSDLEHAVKTFQRVVTRLRYAPYPTVVAPFNMTFGGGCEMSLWADSVQASAELYMGLVEIGVGLIPAGGGTTALLIRFTETIPGDADAFVGVKRAFETIAMAKVSTAALDARNLGLLAASDGISMNADRVIDAAKTRVLGLSYGYVPPPPRQVRALGETACANLCTAAYLMREGRAITPYEETLAKTLARVLTGGTRNAAGLVDEQVILDYEREAFVSLCGNEQTQQRIQHMLETGKSLRN